MIHLRDINKTYQGAQPLHVLKGINLDIAKGEFVSIMGSSGSGKSTLLNILGILDNYDSGEYLLNGVPIWNLSETKSAEYRNRMIGFIFQSVSLIPMMTALENVEFSLRLAGVKKGRKERATECLKMVGLGSRMHHMPQEMSGGEQQRVAIARAMAHRPQIIFADEPTGELDSATAVSVVNLFKEMVEKEGVTIIMTTHDISLMDAGDFVFEMEEGQLV